MEKPEAHAPEPRLPSGGQASWQKTSTVVVYLLLASAVVYIAYAWYTQVTYKGLVRELVSGSPEQSSKAAAELGSTDRSFPYLTDGLLNSHLPAQRALCADVILKRVQARVPEAARAANSGVRAAFLQSGLNLEAITSALLDESPRVRDTAAEIVKLVGTSQSYQKNRRDEMVKFDGLLTRLKTTDDNGPGATGGDVATRFTMLADEFRHGGTNCLPFLVGTVFSDDKEYRRRGLKVLRRVVIDILKASNQRRVVQLMGRRRCALLLAELPQLNEAERPLVTDVLNVSGRVPEAWFTNFLKKYEQASPQDRPTLVREEILDLENVEKAKGGVPTKEIKDLSAWPGKKGSDTFCAKHPSGLQAKGV